MRDKLIHDYFGVEIETVWLTAVEDLPVLKAEVDRVLAEVRLEILDYKYRAPNGAQASIKLLTHVLA